MMALRDLTSHELADLAREKAKEAQEQDQRLGGVLTDLLKTVDELARRFDGNE